MEVSPAKSLILSATIHGGSYFFIQPPMLDYFEELKNGVIATNIDPQLSHGVESLCR